MFRDFKRHYHKAREAGGRLADKGPFQLHVKFDGSQLSAESSTPGQDETIRFAVLMRRFLNPADTLYYRRVWALLREQFKEEISTEVITEVEARIERLNKGYIGVNINGDNLTAEKIYEIISDGEYFDQEEKAQSYLKNLADAPVVGPLLWNQFYAYTLAGFNVAAVLFSIVLQVEASEKYCASHAGSASQPNRCIYCLSTTAGFTSEEHVIPESLGNDEMVMPKGYVCDKCNNGVLSRLDSALLKFEPIAFLQVQFVSYTKNGKLPRANFQNMSIERTGPRSLNIRAKDKTGHMKNRQHLGDDWYSFSFEMRGKKLNMKLLGRALYKIALGMVALSQGHEHACSERYTVARDFILHGKGFPNNLLMRLESTPHPQVRVSYRDMGTGTPMVIDIYGLTFVLNLEETPALELNDELNQANFALYPLHN